MERISDTDINCYLIDIAKTLNKMDKEGKSYRDFDMILKELKKIQRDRTDTRRNYEFTIKRQRG